MNRLVLALTIASLFDAFCGSPPRRHDTATLRFLFPSLTLISSRMPTIVTHINAESHEWQLTIVGAPGSGFVVSGVQRGEGEFGVAQSDLVYTAYRRGTADDPRPYQNLRGVGVSRLYPLFVLVDTDSNIHDIKELRGKRVAIAPLGTGGEPIARTLLSGYGLKYSDIEVHHHHNYDMGHAFLAGTVDAILIAGPADPEETLAPVNAERLRLLPVDASVVSHLRVEYPFIKPTKISWEGRGGTQVVDSIGTDSLVIARSDVPEELVYEVTRALLSAGDGHSPLLIDAEQAAATPIPLHPGAARYYRELQLRR